MAKTKPKPNPSACYERFRERKASAARDLAARGRDIGEITPIADKDRRDATRLDLRLFLEIYFQQTFTLGWSDDHLELIRKIQAAALQGGLFGFAMPRGSGKTSISERACLWAVLHGHHAFVLLIGATGPAAFEMFEAIRSELENNDLLAADFPEVCHPIARLEGIAQRRLLHNGRPITMAMRKGRIVLPDIPGSVSASGIITVASMTARIRGMKFKRPDGLTVRPSFFVADDPQTDESAASPSQCETRERTLAGAVLGLAGPGKRIAGIMPCTVIRKGDMADRFLDQRLHPEWSGERRKLVTSFPQSKRWQEYATIYLDGLRRQDGNEAANAYYRTHRAEMDEGAAVAWEKRHKSDEVSAVQHAMNLKIRDERAFFAEFQNDPLPEEVAQTLTLTADAIAARINRVPRGKAPVDAHKLTAAIDVQGELLYWLVAAWGDEFSGAVVDCGAWPRQHVSYFTLSGAANVLSGEFPTMGVEGRIYAGLSRLTEELLAREWLKPTGEALRIHRCLIDANWGPVTNLVYRFCRESAHSAVLTPSHGRFIGASSQPLSEWGRKDGEERGLEWVLRIGDAGRGLRHCTFNTNFWKSFVHSRLTTAPGDRGALMLCGESPSEQRLLADHCVSEFWVTVEGRGRKVDEWKLRPNRDNHLWDCLVMAAVAANMSRISLREAGGPSVPKLRRRVDYAALQRAALAAPPPKW